jgi:hypothetical protein
MAKNILKQGSKRIQRHLYRLPPLYHWQMGQRFKVERALLNGRHQPISSHPSIIHFSVNKVATQYIKRLLIRCAKENGLIPVRMSEYAWHTNFPYLFTLSAEEVEPYLHIFQPKGYLYTVFGGLVEGIPNVDDYRVVIILRDPRDVLVSGYYSYAFSHAEPEVEEARESFEQFRAYARSLGVDGYVTALCEDTRQSYQRYLDFLAVHPQVYLTRYEEMLADFPAWLAGLLDYCQLEISTALEQKLLAEARIAQPSGEDVSRHRRQGKSGDYRKKLKPETIDYLNRELAPILERLDYPVHAEENVLL